MGKAGLSQKYNRPRLGSRLSSSLRRLGRFSQLLEALWDPRTLMISENEGAFGREAKPEAPEGRAQNKEMK